MRPLLLSLLALFCSACVLLVPADKDEGLPDGGDQPDGGEEVELPDDPSLDQLSAYWDTKQCWLYACRHRLRQTAFVCERASWAEEFPFNVFRKAQDAVAAERGTYNQDRGNACASLLRQLDTSVECFGAGAPVYSEPNLRVMMSACANLLDGQVEHGGDCDEDYECLSGAGCAYGRKAECEGQCVQWLQKDESCEGRWQDCAQGLYCNGEKCVERSLKADNSTCWNHDECRSGKCFAVKLGEITRRCMTTNRLDGECIQEGDCASGLYCRPLPASTGYQGVCQVPVDEGEECGYTIRCKGNQTCAGFFRRHGGGWTAGTCSGKPSGVGEPCVPLDPDYDYGDTGCFGDLICDPATGTCAEPPGFTQSCASDDGLCGLDAYCDEEGVCRAKKYPGEAASGPGECLHGYSSWQQICEDRSSWERCQGVLF